jgi:hypothetical protein
MANSRDTKIERIKLAMQLLASRGLPVHGSIYYFEKHRCRDRVYRFFTSVRGVVGSGQCPFCGKKFVRRAAMVAHIISIHYHDVLHVAGKE